MPHHSVVLPRRRRRPPGARTVRRHRVFRAAIVGTVLSATVAIGLAACSHPHTGLGRLTLDGQGQVTAPHATAHPAHSGDVLHAGDRVQVTAGSASIQLNPSGVIQMRTGAVVVIDTTPRLQSGAILVQAGAQTLEVSALEATLVVPSGVAQLVVGSTAAGLTAKVYQATAQLELVGNPPTLIAAPRQINLTPQTRLPVQATPLQYQETDPWDHLYLSAAAAISRQLGAAASGFNAQVPANEGKDAAFYQQLLPSLSGRPDFPSALDVVERQQPIGSAPAAKPGDYLISSVIALRGTRGSFVNRMTEELVFSAQGAPWGFVAYDQGVTDMTGVLNDVLAAIGRASLPFTAPASQIAIGPPRTTPPTTRPNQRPATPTTVTTTPANHVPRSVTTTTSLPHIQPPVFGAPGILGNILNPLLDPLIQALINILSGRH